MSFRMAMFGCEVVPPERHDSDADLEAGTGIPDSTRSGVHLRLPWPGLGGPMREISTYSRPADRDVPKVNRPGLTHLAFQMTSAAELVHPL